MRRYFTIIRKPVQKDLGRRGVFRRGNQSGPAAHLDKVRTDFGIRKMGAGGMGDPNSPQGGWKIMLGVAVNFPEPAPDTVPHHSLAAALGYNKSRFPKVLRLEIPIAA